MGNGLGDEEGAGSGIAQVSTQDLKPGMYLHDLGVNWAFHPFLYNRFHLDANSIALIQDLGIKHVWIDRSREADSTDGGVPVREHDAAPLSVHRSQKKEKASPAERMQQVTEEARGFVTQMLEQARAGDTLDSQDIATVADGLFDDVARHPCTMLAFGRIRSRDNYTYEHSVNFGVLMMAFAKFLGMPESRIKELGRAGLLHDVGKAFIPDEILQKPGALTEEEYEEVKTHAARGADLLRDTQGVSELSAELAELHHERLDASGYPHGLKSDDLRLEVRISAIVDVYDALTAVRAYHSGSQPTEGLSYIMKQAGQGFDGHLVQRFVRCVGVYPPGSLVRLSSNEIAVVEEFREGCSLQPSVRVVYDANRDRLLDPPRRLDLARTKEDVRVDTYELPERWPIPEGVLQGSRSGKAG